MACALSPYASLMDTWLKAFRPPMGRYLPATENSCLDGVGYSKAVKSALSECKMHEWQATETNRYKIAPS